ncbi:uncharacterized protein LOC143277600 [Babylonia areolata]|uniref:uncharacterized protein LOC143277600 n=1 Tax=Babylonia areolata TaxID=304850 RepID=UPI003FCFF07D
MPNTSTAVTAEWETETDGGGGDSDVELASMYLQYHVTYMLWLVVPPVLLAMGCLGNAMTVVVMSGMRASESTACLAGYFTALALSDLVLLITSVLWDWPFHRLRNPRPVLRRTPLHHTLLPALRVLHDVSLVPLVLPHRVGVLCTARRGKVVIAVIVMVSLVVNLYIFFLYREEAVDDLYTECVSIDEDVAYVFRLLDLFLASLIPFLFLIVANSILIHRVVQSVRMSGKVSSAGKDDQRSAERANPVSSMTTTLIATSAAFLVLTMPTCVLDTYTEAVGVYKNELEDEELNERLFVADTVCALVWMSNSAVNFYVYVLSGRKFREETKRCLCSCFRRCVAPLRE